MAAKKTWTEKMHDSKDLPKVVTLKPEAAEHWHGRTMVVPAPIEVNEMMKKVSRGKLTTIDNIRRQLAKKHKSEIGCPLTTGIFAWIAAFAAEEAELKGEKDITPYWRTLKTDGSLNPKYPGGVENQASRLRKEGFEIDHSKKMLRIKDFEKFI